MRVRAECVLCRRAGHSCPAVSRSKGAWLCLDCVREVPCAEVRVGASFRDRSGVHIERNAFGEIEPIAQPAPVTRCVPGAHVAACPEPVSDEVLEWRRRVRTGIESTGTNSGGAKDASRARGGRCVPARRKRRGTEPMRDGENKGAMRKSAIAAEQTAAQRRAQGRGGRYSRETVDAILAAQREESNRSIAMRLGVSGRGVGLVRMKNGVPGLRRGGRLLSAELREAILAAPTKESTLSVSRRLGVSWPAVSKVRRGASAPGDVSAAPRIMLDPKDGRMRQKKRSPDLADEVRLCSSAAEGASQTAQTVHGEPRAQAEDAAAALARMRGAVECLRVVLAQLGDAITEAAGALARELAQ